jgi:hypothetical protein
MTFAVRPPVGHRLIYELEPRQVILPPHQMTREACLEIIKGQLKLLRDNQNSLQPKPCSKNGQGAHGRTASPGNAINTVWSNRFRIARRRSLPVHCAHIGPIFPSHRKYKHDRRFRRRQPPLKALLATCEPRQLLESTCFRVYEIRFAHERSLGMVRRSCISPASKGKPGEVAIAPDQSTINDGTKSVKGGSKVDRQKQKAV